ncbi:unnamed protein product [Diplocarpon coronariae]|uniref:Uncharacterized protein n=1 Tax=Diplocarpon coronariae TaxID=2795749 RepID=A0A218Z3S3_9HELO|nr:hypothetical protein B2J93_1242 [Marssonina coronariae]
MASSASNFEILELLLLLNRIGPIAYVNDFFYFCMIYARFKRASKVMKPVKAEAGAEPGILDNSKPFVRVKLSDKHLGQ